MNADQENIDKIRRFRELFGGRFNDDDSSYILDRHNFDLRKAVNYIFATDPSEVSSEIERDRRSWEVVRRVRHTVTTRVLNLARTGRIDTSVRLFSCQKCDAFWWRKTPSRKMVSKCSRCRVKYEPVPSDQEWGWAEFNCPRCHKVFSGWCHMQVASPCYGCSAPVHPTKINPPSRRGHRTSSVQHSCAACRSNVALCAHPATRRRHGLPIIMFPSERHDSTGSTVNTCLPQGDLTENYCNVFEGETITEEGSDLSGSDDNDDGE